MVEISEALEITSLILDLAGMLFWLFFFGMVFYLGRDKIKEVDKFVIGHEYHIGFRLQGICVMSYGGAFAWRWAAKRGHLLEIRDEFDPHFQRPFILAFYSMWLGFTSMLGGTGVMELAEYLN